MRIQHNIAALNSYRNLTNNNSAVSKNLEKLSSGYRINRAGDDAAGLAISEKMRAQITGLQTAQKNASDGVSLVQTAEGALTEVHSMLNRMVELATQSANGTYDNEVDRVQLQKELDQLRTEINRIADSSNFNGIKLFDGSLSGADITTKGMTTGQVDMAKGVEVVQGTNGSGSKGVFTINLDSAFGTGDELTISFGGKVGDAGSPEQVTGLGGTGSAVLTFGTDFEGNTIEEQAASIVKKLNSDTNLSKNFEIVANGNTITLTNRVEGNKLSDDNGDWSKTASTVTDVKVSNDFVSIDTTWNDTSTGGVAAADGANGTAQIAKLLDQGDGTGIDISKDDILTFEFKLNTGSGANADTITVKAQLKAGQDFAVGGTPKETLANLASALGNAQLMADDNTIFDDTKLQVKDLYTVSVDNDINLKFDGVDGAVDFTAGAIKVTNERSQETATSALGTPVDNTKKATTIKLKLDTSTTVGTGKTLATNLATGDKLTFKGELADGRTFNFDVEVGKDFKADKSTYSAAAGTASTLGNLKALLESDAFEITLSDGSKVAGSKIFGDKAEIAIDTNAGTFTSNRAGTHTATKLTSVKLTPGDATSVTPTLKNGDQQGTADSVITLSEGLSYGAVVEVGGNKYELVKSAGDVSNGQNKAVIVDDISDINAAAKALANAIKGDVNDADYKVTASNGTVTVATTKVGSTAQAITAAASGDKTTQIEFTLDPTKMKAGSTVTINGQTYEFINKGGKASDKTYETIEVIDFDKESASSLGSRLASLANAKNDASVTVDADGKVTVRGLVNSDNKIVTPTVKFDGGTSGLTLQIGDTAEDFNKMTVSIYNMHTADMGIGDIRIDTQDAAADAVDKIKAAINYVSDVRGTLGATQNRLDHTINNLSVQTENITAAESRIRDVDMAEEMMAYTKNNILVQAAQAMLAQANQVPQGVLQLLQ